MVSSKKTDAKNLIRRKNLPKNAVQQVWIESLTDGGAQPYVATARLREGDNAKRVIWDDVLFESRTKENPLNGQLTLEGTTFASIRVAFVGPVGTKVKLFQQVVVEQRDGTFKAIRQAKSILIEAKEKTFVAEKWIVCTVS